MLHLLLLAVPCGWVLGYDAALLLPDLRQSSRTIGQFCLVLICQMTIFEDEKSIFS